MIHGTLLPEQLLAAFMEALEVLNGQRSAEIHNTYARVFQCISEDRPIGDGDYRLIMEAGDCFEDLHDALNSEAPEGLFFNAHPGDGSDFGFWPIESHCVEGV